MQVLDYQSPQPRRTLRQRVAEVDPGTMLCWIGVAMLGLVVVFPPDARITTGTIGLACVMFARACADDTQPLT